MATDLKEVWPLIAALKESKVAFDKAFMKALDTEIPVQRGSEWTAKPISIEKAQLLARLEVRKQGLEEPEIIRWRLLALLGPQTYGRDTG